MIHYDSKLLTVFLLLFGIASAQEDSGTRILTIGYGTFVIIVSVMIAIIICIVARSTAHPELYSLIALILPLFFILFFVFVPKKKDQPSKSVQSDTNLVTHAIFCTIFIIMFVILMALIFYFGDIVFVYKKARNIAWTGVASSAPVEEEPQSEQIRSEAASDQGLVEERKEN